jgi:bud emergence protein 1
MASIPQTRPASNLIPTSPISPKSPTAKSQVFYAIVMHDFTAERADELDAKRGDTVTVVAQSNREWFVAKPIGRLGRPGLIPVSFVEIHDPATGQAITDVSGLMDRGELPKVEDWKRAMFNYKQNSIALGVLDGPTSRDPAPSSPYNPPRNTYSPNPPLIAAQVPSSQAQGYPAPPPPSSEPELLPEGIIISGDVVSFHFEMEEFWFRINAVWQPYPLEGQQSLPPARQLVLFRVYNDFYDFQVSLLECFPREAGKQPPNPRVLPFMPGPAENVDHQLTATRRTELDEYLHHLCALAKSGATYILEHQVVREFFSLKPGDVENEIEPRLKEMETIFGTEFSGIIDDGYASQSTSRAAGGRNTPYQEVTNSMASMKLRDDPDAYSEYEDEGYAASPQRPVYDRHPYSQSGQNDSNLRLSALKGHQRTGSTSLPNSRSNSPAPRSNSPMTYGNDYSQPQWNSMHSSNSQSTSSTQSSQAGGRARSGSNANNFNSPSISAANPQTAFVKIKIFDRVADDLIAIRVHPKVSHTELMDKVQTRLGGEVANLRYRDSASNTFVGLDNDQELRLWMEHTDKHVLYAD